METMLAAIAYKTFPTIELGPLQLRTFGLAVGLAVLAASVVGAREAERWGIDREASYRLATQLVIAGIVGSRLTWDLTHWSDIDRPLDLIAVWQGGLQFSGGFVLASIVAIPTARKLTPLWRWRLGDAATYGLILGVAIGRVGCTAVGEHFGSTWGASWFPLAVRYEGGAVRELVLGQHLPVAQQIPVTKGLEFHNTAIYELIVGLLIFGLLTLVVRHRPFVKPGTVSALFCLTYGVFRFSSDFLRVNDETTFGLTGAQYMCIVLVVIGIWIWFSRRPALDVIAARTDQAHGGYLPVVPVEPTLGPKALSTVAVGEHETDDIEVDEVDDDIEVDEVDEVDEADAAADVGAAVDTDADTETDPEPAGAEATTVEVDGVSDASEDDHADAAEAVPAESKVPDPS
jgi:phosphatidylglycerol---prolipoprotein diacylglyceryl transferase